MSSTDKGPKTDVDVTTEATENAEWVRKPPVDATPVMQDSGSGRDSICVHLRWPLRPLSDSASVVRWGLVAASEAVLCVPAEP